MAETFDYVAFAKAFESRYGRPPTAAELEQKVDPLEGIVTYHTPEETQAEIERINASYKPSLSERLKTGLSFVTRNFFRAIMLLIKTPVYLTLFFFNLIKSAIGVLVIWFVSKVVVYIAIGGIMDLIHIESVSEAPGWLVWFGSLLFGKQMFTSEYLEPNFFPHPVIDAWIIGIAIIFLALVTTFSKTEV
ncbi:hypothetical protein C1H88_00085 [Streptococcus agalactiae]|uniref:hypothetical protein n=1 Tax=Streptococcus agalactiae TaxID=1311 RepID=UPI001012D88B|nr:hypothetical protein [Streptococcus agalactiae]RXN51059.1 hypothetical protein C1H88_00085 [Streptococcus agalactiae]